jgi:hypothetical protein
MLHPFNDPPLDFTELFQGLGIGLGIAIHPVALPRVPRRANSFLVVATHGDPNQ